MRADVVNGDGNDLADEARVPIKNDDPVVVRPAGELNDLALDFVTVFGSVTRAFNKHFDSLAEKSLAVLLADAVLQLQEVVVAAVFDFPGNVIGVQLGTLRAWALA